MTVGIRTFSYGGGVQSTAALVLAVEGRIDFPVFLFANVGEDSENPDTIHYVENFAKPYAADNGIEMHQIDYWIGIHEHVLSERKSIVIPVRMSNGAPGNRRCTDQWKRRPIARWQREHGATAENKAVCGIGISMDEIHRMRKSSNIRTQVLEYPLIDLGLDREDCKRIIESSGLPVPPKSSCWFCPFKKHADWQEMSEEDPDLFLRAVEFEEEINAKRARLGRDQVRLHPKTHPLSAAVTEKHDSLADETCDTGHCFT